MSTKKVRIVGEKFPPQSNTYAQIDCSKQLKDVLDDLAKDLSVEKSYLENEVVVCRAADGGKVGTPIKMDDVLEMVAAKPIVFLRKKAAAAATPAAKPGAKIAAKPGTKIPPPPPGAKTSSPKLAPGGKSPVGKKLPPPGVKSPAVKSKIPPPPGAAAKKTVPAAKPAAKPSPAPTPAPTPATEETQSNTTPANEESATSSPKNNDDDFDPTAAAEKFGGSLNNSKPPADDSDDDQQQQAKPSAEDDTKDGTGADDQQAAATTSTPPAEEKKEEEVAVVKPTKKVFGKKTVTPPPEAASAPAASTQQQKSSSSAAAPTTSNTTTTASSSGSSGNAILNTTGNSAGMDNVAASLAAQRSVDERLLQLQKGLIDEEKKRLETYENNLRHALAAEVDTIKQQLNASMAEERARSMQVQAVLEEQRTQLLKALAERDGQLQLAQGALQEAVTLGGTKAGPALQAIGGSSSSQASGSSSQLAKEMQAQNDQLKKLLASKDNDVKATKNANRAELDAMIRAQSELGGAMGQLKNSTAPPSSAVEEQKKDLASFLASVGLSRFSEILQKQDIDLEILSAMNDDELQKAGVDTVGARKRILLEFMKNKKAYAPAFGAQQSSPLAASSSSEARELFASSGSPTGGAKKSVVFGENQVTLIPSKDANKQRPTSSAATNQVQQDTQQASIQAANLPPVLQDHHRVLHQLFRRAGAADWLSRSAEMVDSFKDSLPALYEAVCSKLGVPTPNFQQGTGAFALKQFISRRFPHLIPAIDVMVFLADGREAEFADTMMLRQLKIGPQRLVWFSVPVPPSRAPDFAEDTSDGKEKLYFYTALSKMSQWKRPTLFQDKPVPKVVLPGKPLDDGIPQPGEKLSPNPQASRIAAHRATDQQYIAATLSLLMRKDPSKLSQFPDFCRAYERKSSDGQGDGKINYKGMYLDALQAYAPDDD